MFVAVAPGAVASGILHDGAGVHVVAVVPVFTALAKARSRARSRELPLRFVVAPGEYVVSVGGSSESDELRATVALC